MTPIDIDNDIGALVAEPLPQLIGDVVAGAVQPALTETSCNCVVEKPIERLIAPQAGALRPCAQQ
ncbi:hypothetical protein BER93_15995 [Xanthomonas fragariae]|nr:hypothetical protein BER92_15950 [Xanthomonas fragariae]AOD19343.1 hypothetical protein BER93_15995 [Xanthomonas fragariae]ENZ93791.1 hypothetical protein O1K_19331 [Xanthomonas fragariae LMG 25863]